MYCDSAVSFFLFSLVKLDLWFLYLTLNSLAVEPTYSTHLFSLVAVALYTTHLALHPPGRTQLDLQLHGGHFPVFVYLEYPCYELL